MNIQELQCSNDYADFIMNHYMGDRIICNGDTLLDAMEDGYLFEDFLIEKFGEIPEEYATY